MIPSERWRRVERLFEAAADLESIQDQRSTSVDPYVAYAEVARHRIAELCRKSRAEIGEQTWDRDQLHER